MLAEIGARIDVLNSREAIGLGVIKDGHPPTGTITTKAAFERRQANPRATAKGIPRALSHFDWQGTGSLGLLLLDGDEKDNLREILTALYPPFAEIAGLVRPSASASVKDPATGGPLKTGEHLFVILDEPAKAKACLVAVLRLSWCIGVGRSAGWLGLAKDGDPLVYGPVDVTVGSPERLVYEGEVSLDKGLERLPRVSKVIGGNGILCAADLIAFANQHAPVKQFDKLVAKAKAEPAFLAQQAAVKEAYRVDHIEKGVAQGKPREEVEREFDRVTRSAGSVIGDRIWRELSPHQVLYFPDGRPFTAAEMGAEPARFHGKECADPVEGLDYQSRNPGWIRHHGGRVEIYSRAHSDRYAYFLPLYNEEGLGELLKSLGDPAEGAAASLNAEADEAKAAKVREKEAKEKAKQERREAREAKAKAKAAASETSENADEVAPDFDAQADFDQANPGAQADFDARVAPDFDAQAEFDAALSAQANLDAQADFDAASSSGGGSSGGGSGGGGGSGPQPGFHGKTKPVVHYGPLSEMADAASEVLIDAEVPFYQRGKSLVRPVTVPVQSFHGTTASASQLVEVSLPYHARHALPEFELGEVRRPFAEVEGHPSAGGRRAGAAWSGLAIGTSG